MGISGSADDASLPASYLDPAVTRNSTGTTQRLSDVPASQVTSGLRYDGGPANPVPYPKADSSQGGTTIPPSTGLPVSLKKAQPAGPYTFKAYGEK
jgi:hypothetical protein